MPIEYKPRLISWNITPRCNLRCAHCYLDASALDRASADELTTREGIALIDQIADVALGAMLVLSGGEPLLRDDALDLARHASQRGLMVVVGTNGTLLDDALVREMMACGVRGVGISLDSLARERHDVFRGVEGAWARAMRGIEACRRAALAFQIQTTVTTDNYAEIPDLIAFAAEQGAYAFNLFFLVCTGRGQNVSDITPAQYEDLLARLARGAVKQNGTRVRARCAPHLRRLAYQHNPASPLLLEDASRCLAGVEYCRVTPDGQITPCPYMPLRAGHLRESDFVTIWQEAAIFHDLRAPALKGRCGRCEFSELCGGCRARAYATTRDLMADDPWCAYQPTDSQIENRKSKIENSPVWNEEAEARLQRVPLFLREMVRRGVEAYAREKGLAVITPDLMIELRAKAANVPKMPKLPNVPKMTNQSD